jgi:hypothetical protein
MRDPFEEIPGFIREEVAGLPAEKFRELVFTLTTSWLDPMFSRQRCISCFSPDRWRPEEEGLLILISSILGLEDSEPIPVRVLTAFCICTGRTPETMAFKNPDPRVALANLVKFRAPLYAPDRKQITRAISPTLIHIALQKLVPLPTVMYWWGQKPNVTETTDEEEAFEYAGRQMPVQRELVLDQGLTERVRIFKFPMKDGNSWFRIQIDDIAMAYGDDASNGLSKVKYRWENRINGDCPPTLGVNGVGAVEWIDSHAADESFDYGDDEQWQYFCAKTYPDKFVDAFRKVNGEELDPSRNFLFISLDPNTGRLKQVDLDVLNSESHDVIDIAVIECNKFCPCRRRCICCASSQPSYPDLALFYSETKGWGVVATEDIKSGTFLCVYGSEFADEKDDSKSSYSFTLQFGGFWAPLQIDSSTKGNMGRFINGSHPAMHSNQLFWQPNAMPLYVFSSRLGMPVVGIFSLREIYKGEEITMDYGPNYWKDMGKCYCNTCLG